MRIVAVWLFWCLLTVYGRAQIFPSQNIQLLSHLNPETNTSWYTPASKYAGCYGWVNPADNRRYAILGSCSGNYFIEITNPGQTLIRDFVPAPKKRALWREIKTYSHYAYLVSDDDTASFQIADMSYLPDSVHLVHNSDSIFSRAHTLFIDGNKLYTAYVHKTSFPAFTGLAVYSLNNPENPQLLRTIEQDIPMLMAHDMFVRNDTIYASMMNDGLYILKYDSVQNKFLNLSAFINYYHKGYNHSSFLTGNGKYLVFADEVPLGMYLKMIDVSDFNNITLTDTFYSHPLATPHNPYIIGNDRCYVSYYQDGLQIFDISNPIEVKRTGYFDTDTLHGLNDNFISQTYRGCWGAYHYDGTGIIIASDMQNGLFVLDASKALFPPATIPGSFQANLFPNPVSTHALLNIKSPEEDIFVITIFDAIGRLTYERTLNTIPGESTVQLSFPELAPGSYTLKLLGKKNSRVMRFLIAR